MNRKLSKLSLFLMIIQTILTLGFNWIHFLMYFFIERSAIHSVKETTKHNQTSVLNAISCVFYYYMMFMMTSVIILNMYHPYFLFSSLIYNLDVIANHLTLIFIVFILLSTLYYLAYKITLSGIYNMLFNQEKINLTFKFISRGILFVGKVFCLGIYELYTYLINIMINKTAFSFSKFGKFSLIFILTILMTNVLYVINNLAFVPPILLYFVLITLINPFLNYGLHEFKLRMIIKDDFSLFQQEKIERNHFNKLAYSFVVLIIVLFIVNFCVLLINRENAKLTLSINQEQLTCTGDICVKENQTLPTHHITDLDHGGYDVSCDQYDCTKVEEDMNYYLFDYHNSDKIQTNPIKYTNQYRSEQDNVVYKAEGVTLVIELDTSKYYLFVETYYKKIENTYVPLFNIIKNLHIHIGTKFYPTYNIELLQNEVYIYHFLDNELKEYDEGYQNLDTSRLVLDNFNLKVESSMDNFAAIELNSFPDKMVAVNANNQNRFDAWTKYFPITLLDPFMFSSFIFNVSTIFSGEQGESQLTEVFDARFNQDFHVENIQYPYDLQYLVYRYTDFIGYDYEQLISYEDTKNLVYGYMNLFDNNSKLYKNANGSIELCNQTFDACLSDVEYTNTIDISKHPRVYRILYNNESGYNRESFDFIKIHGKSLEDITTLVTYELRTIQQLFSGKEIIHDEIRINPDGYFE